MTSQIKKPSFKQRSYKQTNNQNMLPIMDYQTRAIQADCRLDNLCALDIDSKPMNFRQSGIVCTIGPATRDVSKLVELIKCVSSWYHSKCKRSSKIVGQEMNIANFPIAIALDTKGPEIRTGLLEGGPTAEIELVKGKTIKLTTNDEFKEKCSLENLYLDYKNIVKVVSKGSHVFVDDGLISLSVQEVGSDYLQCEIENGGMLGSKKGVNLPGALVDLPAVSEKDKQDLVFGCQNQVDMIFASFIRNGNGVKEIRQILKDNNCEYIKIISKVENHEGVKKIDDIIRESDGIMVARGDMGIEIPAQKVFLAQKMMIAKCNIAGKPVICATQMLESMTKKPRPTRAEVSDVANAVLDGADCVMLSGETAKGDYPFNTVATMAAIAVEAETAIHSKQLFVELCGKTPVPTDVATSLAISAVDASLKSNIVAIIVVTSTGRLAHLISKYRPRCPIIAIIGDERIARQAHLYRGIIPYIQSEQNPDDCSKDVQAGIQLGKQMGILRSNDSIIIVNGSTMRISQVD
ncbi:pyruvate kinase-like protein [Dermatophagoides farinae]|uniref:Pyruvate kinase n=1 Tax=Dermatophagoides farinae TaxID=6954 RepID=A0A9D4NYV1_DERFA|nr:pyruvate kinase-like protein [Dermatophagoides farinae]